MGMTFFNGQHYCGAVKRSVRPGISMMGCGNEIVLALAFKKEHYQPLLDISLLAASTSIPNSYNLVKSQEPSLWPIKCVLYTTTFIIDQIYYIICTPFLQCSVICDLS